MYHELTSVTRSAMMKVGGCVCGARTCGFDEAGRLRTFSGGINTEMVSNYRDTESYQRGYRDALIDMPRGPAGLDSEWDQGYEEGRRDRTNIESKVGFPIVIEPNPHRRPFRGVNVFEAGSRDDGGYRNGYRYGLSGNASSFLATLGSTWDQECEAGYEEGRRDRTNIENKVRSPIHIMPTWRNPLRDILER